jgi:hypothetical protein
MVNIAVAALACSEPRTQVAPNHVQNRLPESDSTCQIANQWRKNVASAELLTDCGAEGFLSAAQKDAAVYLSRPIQARHLVIQDASQLHASESLQKRFPR